jgi:hypothetical protein
MVSLRSLREESCHGAQMFVVSSAEPQNIEPQRGLRPQPNKTRGSLAEVAETAEKSK